MREKLKMWEFHETWISFDFYECGMEFKIEKQFIAFITSDDIQIPPVNGRKYR